ncbi:MAG: SRPBCC family protein [Chloroflexaceae bacterium]|nr:SRPBCC family protein [Chloroflexaceae bacterium]
MITVHLQSYVNGATPKQVFDALSDPSGLKTLMPRLSRVEYERTSPTTAHVVMYISIGGMFGLIRCDGVLEWIEPGNIIFTVNNPLPVKNEWIIKPTARGTEVNIQLNLDLRPFLGPMANFVPTIAVEDLVRRELKHAVAQIPKRLKEQDQMVHGHERAMPQPVTVSGAAA